MSGGIIRYTKYSCPHCGASLSNDAIAIAQARGVCSVCDQPLRIDAAQALPKTGETMLAGMVVLAMYVAAVWGLVNLLQVDIASLFKKLPPFWRIVASFAVLAPGLALAKWVESSEVKRLLRVAKEMRDEQHEKGGSPGP